MLLEMSGRVEKAPWRKSGIIDVTEQRPKLPELALPAAALVPNLFKDTCMPYEEIHRVNTSMPALAAVTLSVQSCVLINRDPNGVQTRCPPITTGITTRSG